MSAPDERNPLARALDELGDGPEARAYAIPVEAVRAGARRRRARRTGVVSGVAVVAVGAVVGGAYAGLPFPGRGDLALPGPGPSPTTASSAAATADWPAQFDRCGMPVAAALPDIGDPMTLTLDDASDSVPADGAWHASVTADLPTAPSGVVAVVWATDLSVVRDGVVVGVQDGPTAPDLSLSLDDRLGGGSLRTSPFPITTDVTLALASCDQYPGGQGSPDLTPGSYDLVVTQTISYAPPGVVTTQTDVRVSARTTVTVTAPAHTAGATADPTACGAPADALAALADPQTNPSAFPLDAEVTGDGFVGLPLPMAFTIPADASDVLGDGLVLSKVQAVLTRNRVVVGYADQAGGGTSLTFGAASDCSADHPLGVDAQLPAGSYEVWVVLDVHPVGPTTPDVRVATGPWPVTLNVHPTPLTALDTLTACGAPGDALAALADSQDGPAPFTVTLDSHSVPYDYPNISLAPTLTPAAGQHPALDTVEEPVFVVTQNGAVVARSVVTGGPDPTADPSGVIRFADPPAVTRCPGAAAPPDGGSGLAPGDYENQVVVELTVTGADARTWLIASVPTPWMVDP